MSQNEPPAAPPNYVWARPQQAIAWVESEPLEYHRVMRGTPRYRWWKPLLALILGVIYYFSLSVAFTLIVLIPYLSLNEVELTQDAILELALPDTQRPISMLIGLGSIALMIPAGWLALLSVGLGKIGRVWSVAGKMRWRWIWRSILPAFAVLIVMNVVGIGIDLVVAGERADQLFAEPPTIDWTLALWSGVLILLLVPLQSAAEEFAFRGMMLQALGAWIKSPWPAIVLPSVLFGISHIYDIWGLLSVTAMALTMGWLAWRTGGLEIAITLHVVNNWVAFGFMAVAFGGETGQTESSGGPGSMFGTVVGLVLYAWWMDRMFRKRDGVRTRVDFVEGSLPA